MRVNLVSLHQKGVEIMIYFDHAATTPLDESVDEDMKPFFTEKFGNPSSIYEIGREAKLFMSVP